MSERSMQPTLVNRQFNSPIQLYSPQNVAETLNKKTQILANGAVGINFHQLAAPGNLANSAVLRMLEEEERQRGGVKGLKRVAWPPPPEPQDLLEGQPLYQEDIYDTNLESAVPSQPQKRYIPATSSSPQYFSEQTPQVAPVPQPPFELPAQVSLPPTTVVLRQQAPISQAPPPVFTSQPAATKGFGPKMRGDQKWPPAAQKAQAEAENEARKALARGPACRPRKVKKDYGSFFAQNALTPNYPAYRAPPGTQHYVEEGTSNF